MTHADDRRRHSTTGFSIIELVVTMALLTIITALVVSSGRSSQQPLRLLNNAYEVALFIREAQVSASSVLGGSSIKFDSPIVVRVEAGPGMDEMVMFVDVGDNGDFDAGIDTELRKLKLEPRMEVKETCAGGSCAEQELCIRFKRPSTTATISRCQAVDFDDGRITIGSTIDGTTQHVDITRIGLITVP